jgi:hypothetical protein
VAALFEEAKEGLSQFVSVHEPIISATGDRRQETG